MSGDIIFVTGGYDHTIRFWHPHDGVCYRSAQHADSQVNALAITPDKKYVAAAGYQHVKMYHVCSTDTNPVIDYDGISKNVTAVGFCENGKWMYTGGEDGFARIWDLRSRNMQCQRLFQANAPINCVFLHPNQAAMVVSDQTGALHLWDLIRDTSSKVIPEVDVAIHSVSIDPDGAYLAAVNSKGTCFVWSLSGGVGESPILLNPRTKIIAHPKYALKCLFSPDSSLLATTSADGTCKIWSTADFTERNTLRKGTNKKWVWDCAFSSDSQYVITACSDHVARLWHAEQSHVVREYQGHQKAIVALAYDDRH